MHRAAQLSCFVLIAVLPAACHRAPPPQAYPVAQPAPVQRYDAAVAVGTAQFRGSFAGGRADMTVTALSNGTAQYVLTGNGGRRCNYQVNGTGPATPGPFVLDNFAQMTPTSSGWAFAEIIRPGGFASQPQCTFQGFLQRTR